MAKGLPTEIFSSLVDGPPVLYLAKLDGIAVLNFNLFVCLYVHTYWENANRKYLINSCERQYYTAFSSKKFVGK